MTTDERVLVVTTGALFPGRPGDSVARIPLATGTPQVFPLPGAIVANAAVISVDDPDRWLVPTRMRGVLLTEDAGGSWREVNQGLTYKEVWSLVRCGTGALLAGTGPAAVFASDDEGESWRGSPTLLTMKERRHWEFPGPPFHAHVKNFGASPQKPELVFGAIEEGHLIRSFDAGRSWESVRDGVEYDCHGVCVLPGDPDIVVATTGTGVYRSTDGGDSFANVTGDITSRYMAPPVTHPDRPGVVFAGGAATAPLYWGRPSGARGMLYRSEDSGEHWDRLTGGFPDPHQAAPTTITIDPRDPDHVYFGLSDGSLWFTPDSGESFVELAGGLDRIVGITVVDPHHHD